MNEPRYAPEFDLQIDGRDVPATLRSAITGVTFTTGLLGADRVEVRIANQQLRWLDDPLLALDRPLTLSLGYAGRLVTVFSGEVTGTAASFPSDNLPQLTVTAQDRRNRLTRGAKGRWFIKPAPGANLAIPDSVVGDQIAMANGMVPQFDPIGAQLAPLLGQALAMTGADPGASQKDAVRQVQETDDQVMQRLARKNGWEMLVEHAGAAGGRVLHFFSPLDRLRPELTLKYGESLIEFSPRESTAGLETEVTANVWIAAVKKRIGVTLSADPTRPGLLLKVQPTPPGGDGKASGVVIDEPLSPASAPGRLLGELLPRLNQRLTGSGSTVGDPRVRAGMVLRLEGLGVRFGGLYRVTSATHSLDGSGYRTSFEVRKEIWFEQIAPETQGAVKVPVPVRVQV
jgi:phage protein D